jgi:phosphate uptake regulator
MRRKIIKQGHNTLTITLPSDWAKKLDLNAGDELDLIEKESSLILSPDKAKNDISCTIDIKDFTVPMLWRYFQGAYRSGANEIKIVFDPSKRAYDDAYHFYTTQFDYSKLGEKISSKPALAMIQGVVDRFIGMGVIETGRDYCLIKEMGESTMKEFDSSFRRIFLVILQLFDRTIEAIERNEIKDVNLCKEIHTMDLNVDRLVDYCGRILNKNAYTFSESKKMLLWSILFQLELIGDEFKYIGKHIVLSKKSIKEVLQLIRNSKEYFDMYYKFFYNFDRQQAVKLGKSDVDVYSQHFKEKGKLQGESRSIARHLSDINKMVLCLSELRIQMEF